MTADDNILPGDDIFVAYKRPFNDPRLSWEARGLLAYIMSNPGWDLNNDILMTDGPAGQHKTGRMLRELKKLGYVRRFRRNTHGGLFEWVTEVYENPELNPDYSPQAESDSCGLENGRSGYVYLAYCETGHHKIGVSASPSHRIKAINTRMPLSVELEHIIPADDMYAAEAGLHQRFDGERQEGEWFLLGDEDVRYILSLERFEQGEFHTNAASEVVS